jgi:hypothetical protein
MKMNAKILKYREEAIHQMARDIEDLQKNGIDGDELWDAINLNNYSCYSTEEDKIRAFEMAGYTVETE